MLNLRGQAEGTAALAPLEQVGVSPVGDHHEREQIRDLRDIGQRLRGRFVLEVQLQQADGLPALGHRRQHPPPSAGTMPHLRRVGPQHLDGLGAHRLLLRPAVEGQHGRRLLVVASFSAAQRRATVSFAASERDMGEADQCATGHVRDEEGHGCGSMDGPEAHGDVHPEFEHPSGRRR